MNPAMQMQNMPMMNMMPMNGMSGMMPMNGMAGMMPMNAMMGMMNPMMMGMMNPMMMGGMMPMMMCKMSCEMTDKGMVCTMMPMDGMSKEMFDECCKRMMACMNNGMPMTMACGGMMMMCTMG